MEILSLTGQQSREIKSTASWQAEGVHARSLRNLAGLDLRLLELAVGGELGSPAVTSDRCYYVLSGNGEIGKPGGLGERLNPGDVAALEQGEGFFIRNTGNVALQIMFIRGAEEGAIEKPADSPPHEGGNVADSPPREGGAGGGFAGSIIPNASHRVMIWFDGGSDPNPGPSYGSYALFAPDASGNWPDTPDELKMRLDFGHGSNNEAEYKSLIAGLEEITRRVEAAGQPLGKWEIEVRGDSRLVLNQVGGEWQVKKESLRPLTNKAQTLLKNFGKRTLTWHSRTNSVKAFGH